MQAAQLGRELLGSNGLLGEFLVSKALADMEGVHSYEGTYVSWVVGVREFEGGLHVYHISVLPKAWPWSHST